MYCEYIICTREPENSTLTFEQKVQKLSIRKKSDGLWRVRLLRSNWPHEATRALPPGCWKQLAPGYWATWKTFQLPKVTHLCKLTNISPMPISALISSLYSFLKTNIARIKKPSVKGKNVFFLISKPFVSGVTRAVHLRLSQRWRKSKGQSDCLFLKLRNLWKKCRASGCLGTSNNSSASIWSNQSSAGNGVTSDILITYGFWMAKQRKRWNLLSNILPSQDVDESRKHSMSCRSKQQTQDHRLHIKKSGALTKLR